MLQSRKTLMTWAMLGALALLAAPTAQAGLIPVKAGATNNGDGTFTWQYTVVVTSDVYVQPGDYFTVYDFGQNLKVTSSPADWAMSVQNNGNTPDKTNPADDPNIENYTWTYNGATTLFGPMILGTFALTSPYGQSAQSDFTSATHRQDNDRGENNITTTIVPVPSAGGPPQTPEPATLALAAAGLPLIGLLRRRRR